MIAASIVWIGGNTWFAGFQSEITMSLDIVFIVISGAAAITILALAVLYKMGTRAGKGWLLTGIGLAIWSMGELAYGLLEIAGNAPYPSVADVIYLIAYFPITAGLVMLAVLFKQRLGRMERVAIMVLLSLAVCIVVVFVMVPAINQLKIDGDVAGQVMGFLYPSLDIILIACVIIVAAKIRRGKISRAWLHILVGFALMGVADAFYWVAYTNHTFVSFSFQDLLYFYAYLLLVAGGLRIRLDVLVSSSDIAK